MTLESLKKKDNDELYLSDLFKIVFNHFILIAVIAIVFVILGITISIVQPEKYNLDITLQLKTPSIANVFSKYGYDYYTTDYLTSNLLFNRNILNSLNQMGKPESELNQVEKTISLNKDTFYYVFSAKNIEESNIDFYKSFLLNLIDNVNKDAKEKIESNYTSCLTYIQEILEKEKTKEYATEIEILAQKDRINTYQQDLDKLERFNMQDTESITIIDVLELPIEGKAPMMIAIVAFILGGVFGVIIAFAIDFTDKRIYSTTQLARTLDIDDIITSIPLYKNMAINEKDTQYIANKIRDKGNNILVTSVSDRSGKTSIADGLKRALKEEHFIIEDGNTFSKDIDMLKKIKEADISLVVLKAGFDKLPNMIKVLRDMLTVEAKNIYVILNGVDYSDKNINYYEDKSAYNRHIWIVETWKYFYKKNSFR